MTQEEYNSKRASIQNEADTKLSILAKEYAFSNSTVKVGDVIKDHYQIIKVTSIKYAMKVGAYWFTKLCLLRRVVKKRRYTQTKGW